MNTNPCHFEIEVRKDVGGLCTMCKNITLGSFLVQSPLSSIPEISYKSNATAMYFHIRHLVLSSEKTSSSLLDASLSFLAPRFPPPFVARIQKRQRGLPSEGHFVFCKMSALSMGPHQKQRRLMIAALILAVFALVCGPVGATRHRKHSPPTPAVMSVMSSPATRWWQRVVRQPPPPPPNLNATSPVPSTSPPPPAPLRSSPPPSMSRYPPQTRNHTNQSPPPPPPPSSPSPPDEGDNRHNGKLSKTTVHAAVFHQGSMLPQVEEQREQHPLTPLPGRKLVSSEHIADPNSSSGMEHSEKIHFLTDSSASPGKCIDGDPGALSPTGPPLRPFVPYGGYVPVGAPYPYGDPGVPSPAPAPVSGDDWDPYNSYASPPPQSSDNNTMAHTTVVSAMKYNQCTYTIITSTGNIEGAGTSADVNVEFFDKFGNSVLFVNLKSQNRNFDRGATDTFTVVGDCVQHICRMHVSHDDSGPDPSWFVNTVTVSLMYQTHVFNVFEWLSKDEPPYSLSRTISSCPA